MNFTWNFAASKSLYQTDVAYYEAIRRIKMKLLILLLSLLLLSFAACNQAQSNNVSLAQVPTTQNATNRNQSVNCVNLNKASVEELNTLPGIGEVMAQKIIAYRERHGSFRRPQEIIIIEGFSEKKYRTIAELICVD
jgi:competence ComEA-like helix-hairpin-helix protein